MAGTLYVCATPIGNLEDITLRVLRVLREADFIAAEDTRHTQKLLNYYEIKARTTSYHEHNKRTKGPEIISRLLAGESCALVTDAGMPGISDPGEDLIRLCYQNEIFVTVCPGATAGVTALALSGLPSRRFCFEAFLPQDKKERERIVSSFVDETRTILLYEAPHRLLETLRLLYCYLGDGKQLAVIRELTKQYEQMIQGDFQFLIDYFKANEPRGEFVIVIKGTELSEIMQSAKERWLEMDIYEHLKLYLDRGLGEKEAMKRAAKDRGISKREVYAQIKCL